MRIVMPVAEKSTVAGTMPRRRQDVENAAWLARMERENKRRLALRELGCSDAFVAKLDEIRDRGQLEHQEELRETNARLRRLIPLR